MSDLAERIRVVRDKTVNKDSQPYHELTMAAIQLDAAEAEVERLTSKLHNAEQIARDLKEQSLERGRIIAEQQSRLSSFRSTLGAAPCKRLMLQKVPYDECFPFHNCDGCDCWRAEAAAVEGQKP